MIVFALHRLQTREGSALGLAVRIGATVRSTSTTRSLFAKPYLAMTSPVFVSTEPTPPVPPPHWAVRVALIVAVPLVPLALLGFAWTQAASGRRATVATDQPLSLNEAKAYLEKIRAKHSYVYFPLPDSATEVEFAVASGSDFCELICRFRVDPETAREHARKWLRDPKLEIKPIDTSGDGDRNGDGGARWRDGLKTRLGSGFEVPWFNPGSIRQGWRAQAGAESIWFDEEEKRLSYHSYAGS